MRDREFHPEWGYLAFAPSVVRTLRSQFIAAAVGAVVGSGMVLLLVGRGPDDSIAARTLVSSEPTVTTVPSEGTPVKIPSPARLQFPPNAARAKVGTAATGAEREGTKPDDPEVDANLSLLQRHSDSTEGHETVPSRNLDVSTPRAEAARRPEANRKPPHRANHNNPALAANEATAQHEPLRSNPPTREVIANGSNPKDQRNTDLTAFFQPWWYVQPARERRRNPG